MTFTQVLLGSLVAAGISWALWPVLEMMAARQERHVPGADGEIVSAIRD